MPSTVHYAPKRVHLQEQINLTCLVILTVRITILSVDRPNRP